VVDPRELTRLLENETRMSNAKESKSLIIVCIYKDQDIMATKKKSSKKGLASASKKTKTRVAKKGGKS
jgi:hypothetical protein